MHGREGEEWKQRRHMWSVPVLGTATSAAQKQAVTSPLTVPAVDSVQTSPDSFLKDGRTIRVGDCALFQAGNAPPFIGIIRWLSTDKEAYLKLCVNWLYRPADVKLAKGILLEAAPNEVFYSFHKDVISAASLLHPCKVAFLCKGVELPLGISSFVCRRVYDIANKCLWWLSDQDYINEHQEEVDQLLDKTRLEMHAAVQSGGRSPKRLNGPSSTQQLKSGSDSVQNNGSSLTSQMKGKKRERSDQITDPNKRERISKADDGDSSGFKFENNMIKSEISKITEKGALVSTDGVEKLVQLMLLDNGKKIDLTGRVLFADVIAATERIDCLNKFVQIRGVPVLDEWLQEAHKGKIGDANSPKESDKAVEELLLALLRALDKLPVNLNALQTCNIGKSVNHLRSHKNLEIQKKARSLVDTWKKRVDAEIKTNDAKPTGSSQTVAWPVKPGFSEVSHVGNRRVGSGELSMKGSATQQTACKGLVGKSVHGDATVKSATVVVASGKLQSSVATVGISPKDSPSKVVGSGGASDPPQMVIKEEKSSSSSQSQNNSQSCSSDHGKTVGSSLKEDARSSTAVSVNATKTSGVSARHRRSSNGFVASNISGGQKESDSSKSGLLSQNLTSGKLLQAGVSCERTVDVPPSDNGLSHRLIVRLPNPGRSPARNTSGGFLEDPAASSRASSPGVLDKHDHGDCKVIGWNDSSRTPIAADVNAESWQSNDAKDGMVGSDEGDRLSTIPDEERKPADDASRVVENYRTACSSSSHEKGPGVVDPNRRKSLSSMNALIESCAKYCEVTTLSGGDDVGMNLLASVAAGEISKKDVVSPATSPRGSLMEEDPCIGTNEAKPTILAIDSSCQNLVQSSEHVDFDSKRHGKDDAPMLVKNEVEEVDTVRPVEDNQTSSSMLENKVTQNDVKQEFDREVEPQNHEDKRIDGEVGKSESGSVSPVDKIGISSFVSDKNAEDEGTKVEASEADQKPQSGTETGIEVVERKVEDASTSGAADKIPCSENADTSKRSDGMDGQCHEHSERNDSPILPPSSKAPAGSASSQHGITNGAEPLRRKRSLENHGVDMVSTVHQEAEACPKMSAADGERKDELASSAEVSTAEQDAVAKLDFDLNEGIIGEDVNQNEPMSTVLPVCTPAVRMSNLSSLVTSPVLAGAPALITVAAPAKGPFRPPENLLKSKGELGWKGSAATSAFRPAEPRKVLEMPLNSADVMSSDNAVPKQGRPPLEIDLNVADDRAVEDMASQSSAQTTGSESGVISNHDAPFRSAGGLDLDLNLVDEGAENGQFFANSCRRLELPVVPARSAAEGFQNGEVNIFRDFDLNNGPSIDDVVAEPVPRSQSTKICANIPIVTPSSLGTNNANLGNGWFPPGNSYPAVAIPSFLPDRGDHPYPIIAAAGAQRILGSVTGAATIGSEVYRGPVLSSSPALAFSPAATAFSYAGFPFNANFPLASTAFSAGSSNYVDHPSGAGAYFPPIPSPLVGPGGGVSSPFTRPYVLTLPEGTASGVSESTRKWARHGLDLNAGPGSTDELKDDRLSSSRQLHAASSHSFMEDPGRLYHVAGGLLKRKEPDGGWESERFTFKQPPLQ